MIFLKIRCIQELIGPDVPIYSVVVFSERCELKRVDVSQKDVRVVKRNQVAQAVIRIADQSETELSQDEIDKIYETLHPYTQVSDAVKAAHIEWIRQQHDGPEEKPRTTVMTAWMRKPRTKRRIAIMKPRRKYVPDVARK